MIAGLAEYEKKLGKSVLDFTTDNFIDFLSQYQGTNRRSMRNQKSYLNAYLDWLEQRGYPAAHAAEMLDPVTYDDLSLDHAFAKYYFRDFDSLKSHLSDRIEAALEQGYICLLYTSCSAAPSDSFPCPPFRRTGDCCPQ